jgi:hypothetical protein
MTPHKALPLPPWSLLADGLAAAMLAVGLLVLFSRGLLEALQPIPALGWGLDVLGGAGMLASIAAIFMHFRRPHS